MTNYARPDFAPTIDTIDHMHNMVTVWTSLSLSRGAVSSWNFQLGKTVTKTPQDAKYHRQMASVVISVYLICYL